MNKAITDGLALNPPAFAGGLGVWSSGDGTPGSPTYDGATNAAFVPNDQDFGGCLELVKTDDTQKLRFTGQTAVLPGCYLRVTIRIKAITGRSPGICHLCASPLGPGMRMATMSLASSRRVRVCR